MARKIKVGDYITFTTTTRGSGKKKVRRQVVVVEEGGHGNGDGIGVRYDGWNPYWLCRQLGDKIHKVERTK